MLLVASAPLTRLGFATLIQRHARFELCAEAGEARTGRELLQQKQPDVIVIELSGLAEDGTELLRDCRRLSSATRALVISDHEDVLSLERAFRAGTCGYVSRRDHESELLAGLNRILEGELFASRRVAHLLLHRLAKNGVAHRDRHLAMLSDRELQVYRLVGSGQGAMAIARELGLSVKTVETHRQRIKIKLHISTGAELNRSATEWISRREKHSGA